MKSHWAFAKLKHCQRCQLVKTSLVRSKQHHLATVDPSVSLQVVEVVNCQRLRMQCFQHSGSGHHEFWCVSAPKNTKSPTWSCMGKLLMFEFFVKLPHSSEVIIQSGTPEPQCNMLALGKQPSIHNNVPCEKEQTAIFSRLWAAMVVAIYVFWVRKRAAAMWHIIVCPWSHDFCSYSIYQLDNVICDSKLEDECHKQMH